MKLDFKSERLLLRPLADFDLDVAYAILTDPEVMKFVGQTYTKDQVIAELPSALKRGGGGCIGIWCVIEQSTNEKLGTALLLPLPVEEEDTNWDLVGGTELPDCEVEIGYILRQSAWGKGYATEAARRLLKFAFEDSPLEDIVAITDPENTASQRVLEKCGFVYEGLRRAYAAQCPGFRITRRHWLQENRETS
jgi:ribosomal-protein-alanine N-acetyltransferase